MPFLEEEQINCPYCGEPMVVLIDPEDVGQNYIEDCQVCCRPINFQISENFESQIMVNVSDENEV